MSQRGASAQAVFPIVDYATHPGFLRLHCTAGEDDAQVQDAFANIDRALQVITKASPKYGAAEIEKYFQHAIDSQFERILTRCDPCFRTESLLGQWTGCALRETRTMLLKEVQSWREQRRFVPRKASFASRKVAKDLEKDGIALTHIPQTDIEAIWQHLEPFREELLKKQEYITDDSPSWVSPPLSGEYWQVLSSALHKCGAIDGACNYARRSFMPSYCGLMRSHSKQRWYKDCYADAGMPTAQTVTMHVDHDSDSVKMIIYLNKVGQEQGPFSFLRGSHRWARSFSQFCFFKMLDRQFGAGVEAEEPGSIGYYRKQFKLPQFRKRFVSLPKPLQGTSHFGDDVMDGTELSRYLLKKESAITSDQANCVIFHGGMGIHRGGLVQEGERWALQLAMHAQPNITKQPLLPLRQRAATTVSAALKTSVRFLLGDKVSHQVKALLRKPR